MGIFSKFKTRAEPTVEPQIDDVLLMALLNGETITREKGAHASSREQLR